MWLLCHHMQLGPTRIHPSTVYSYINAATKILLIAVTYVLSSKSDYKNAKLEGLRDKIFPRRTAATIAIECKFHIIPRIFVFTRQWVYLLPNIDHPIIFFLLYKTFVLVPKPTRLQHLYKRKTGTATAAPLQHH